MPQPVEVVVLPTPSQVGRQNRSGIKDFVNSVQPANILSLNSYLKQKHSA
jgi:hypothetical protein